MPYGDEGYGGGPYGGGAPAGGSSFSCSPPSGHATGSISLTLSRSGGTPWSGSPFSKNGGTATWSITSQTLVDDATYTVVINVSALGTCIFNDTINGTTATYDSSAVAPNAPVIGTAVKGNGSASVPFTESTDAGGSAITGHTATASPGGATGTGSSPITVSGLTNGTSYTFTVHSTNAVGDSVESSASNAVVPSTVPSAPTIGTAIPGDTYAQVAFTAGANGGNTVIDYTATASPGGATGTLTQSGSGTITVNGLTNGVSYTFTVHARNSNGNSAESSASNSVTPAAWTPYTGCARFNGAGSNRLRIAADPAETYPQWFRAEIRPYRLSSAGGLSPTAIYANGFQIFNLKRTAADNGLMGYLFNRRVYGRASDGTSSSSGFSPKGTLAYPDTDVVTWEFTDATHCKIWINDELQWNTAYTSRVFNLSAGTPYFEVGGREEGTQGYEGDIANFLRGTGTLDATAITALNVIGPNPASILPVGGILKNYYPLSPDTLGNDIWGTAHLSPVGTMTYSTETLARLTSPTRAQAQNYVHGQDTVLSGLPTVVASQSLPISTAGWSNLSRVDHLDISFTGRVSAWNTRHYLCVPTVSNGHLVIADTGHVMAVDWDTYWFDEVIKQLVALHYPVLVTQGPGYNEVDPTFIDAYTAPDHNDFQSLLTPSANPFERWTGPTQKSLNYLAPLYNPISIIGLSGGGQRAVWTAAVDTRINHAIVCMRGIIDSRNYLGYADWEQWMIVHGWREREFFRLCAAGATPNRRLWLAHHPTDSCCFGQLTLDPGGQGAYISQAAYTAEHLAAISAAYPYADVQMKICTGDFLHHWNQTEFDAIVLPALSTALTTVPAGSLFRPAFLKSSLTNSRMVA